MWKCSTNDCSRAAPTPALSRSAGAEKVWSSTIDDRCALICLTWDQIQAAGVAGAELEDLTSLPCPSRVSRSA